MVYIRTDANEKIATGHVMRCLTIAEEIIQLKEKVCFVVSSEVSVPLIKERNFEIIITNTQWDDTDIEYEFNLLSNYAEKGDVLLVDSYFLTSEYLLRMRKIFCVAVFDDMFAEKKMADIIINYNIFYKRFKYDTRYCNDNCQLLLGEKYVPLRKQFDLIEPHEKVQNLERPKVLLMCGGGDTQNMIYRILLWLKTNKSDIFDDLEWNVVIGNYNPNKKIIEQFAATKTNIALLENVKNMAELMSGCDLCITAASTVLYECCAMLLPTIFVVVADDQKYDAECFTKDNMMRYCGNFMYDPNTTLEEIGKTLQEIAFDKFVQQDMKNKMKNVVDTHGAQRIAKVLVGIK